MCTTASRPASASLVPAFLVAALLTAAGCGGSAPAAPGTGDLAAGGGESGDLAMLSGAPGLGDMALGAPPASHPLVVARPYADKVPAGYDASRAWPLLILLHGYSANGAGQDAYFGLSKIVDDKGFLYAYPDGTVDAIGNRFWNADDACCDLFKNGVDDVAYINAIIDDMSYRYRVDPRRVFVAGHSNGAFMAHRLACDSAHRIAAFAALAGDVWKDPGKCNPSEPVAALQIHGDADVIIPYAGGFVYNQPPFPAAPASVGTWAQKNGCGQTPEALAPLDLDTVLVGAETGTQRWPGCKGGDAQLWTIHGGGHIPSLGSSFAPTIWDWLAAHGKP